MAKGLKSRFYHNNDQLEWRLCVQQASSTWQEMDGIQALRCETEMEKLSAIFPPYAFTGTVVCPLRVLYFCRHIFSSAYLRTYMLLKMANIS